jgi:hypothetical protein
VTVLNRAPVYGDIFQATEACVSKDNATDVLTVGALYRVIATGGYTDPKNGTGSPPTDFVYLVGYPTDTRHFGDGAFSMHMPVTCGVPVSVSP